MLARTILREERKRAKVSIADCARHLTESLGEEYPYNTYREYEVAYKKPKVPAEISLHLFPWLVRKGANKEKLLAISTVDFDGLPAQDGIALPVPVVEMAAFRSRGELEAAMSDARAKTTSDIHGDNLVGSPMEGHSMSRVIPHGTMVIYDLADRTPRDHKVYMASHNDGVVVRRYRSEPPRLEADSMHGRFETIFKGFEIIARAIQFKGDL